METSGFLKGFQVKPYIKRECLLLCQKHPKKLLAFIASTLQHVFPIKKLVHLYKQKLTCLVASLTVYELNINALTSKNCYYNSDNFLPRL